MQDEKAVWLVTGSGSGFGREIVKAALAGGQRVIATARKPDQLADIAAEYPHTCRLVPLDVTKPDQVAVAVAETENLFGRLDVLVNNAGYGFIAAVEEALDAEIRHLMETHFFGSVELIKKVLPSMRQRRYGHIINFSSIAGIMASPGTAYYAAAKFAIEGLSEGLSKEVAEFGIKVTLVEPGPFQTNFFKTSRRLGAQVIDDYAATAGAYRKRANNPDLWLPGDPARGAQAICAIALKKDAPLRLLLGKFAYDTAATIYQNRLTDMEQWKAVALSADHPDAAGRPWP